MLQAAQADALIKAMAGHGRYAVIAPKAVRDDVADAIDKAYPEQRGKLGSPARIALSTYEGARLECDYCDVAPNHYEAVIQFGEPAPLDDGPIDF